MSIEALILLGAAAVLTGLLATIVVYVNLRRSYQGAAPSFIRYFATAAVLALLTYFIGSAVGIYGACRSPSAGNLCGIWGALGSGPLLSGTSLWVYGFYWRKRLAK